VLCGVLCDVCCVLCAVRRALCGGVHCVCSSRVPIRVFLSFFLSSPGTAVCITNIGYMYPSSFLLLPQVLPTHVTYNSLLNAYAKKRDVAGARRVARQMSDAGIEWDVVTYVGRKEFSLLIFLKNSLCPVAPF
jgi:pentatricopeptide repeat protein